MGLHPPPAAGVVHLNLARGGFVGILGLAPGRFRLFGALSPAYAARFAVDGGQRVAEETLQPWFDEYFAVEARVADVGWTSTYRVHHHAGYVGPIGDLSALHAYLERWYPDIPAPAM